MIKKLMYYISNSLDPYKNLAIEKYLLDFASDDCFILYLWQNQNTVVIGKNQNPWAECDCSLLEKEGGRVARRLSGGGAVYHDIGNLNFTFLCATKNFDIARQIDVIKEACSLAGLHAEVSGRNDILINGRKFSGNAFYNSKGKSYHHGTLLIDANIEQIQRYLTPPKAKLDVKGVKSVKSRVANLTEFAPALTCSDMTKYMLDAFQNIFGMPAEQFVNIDAEKITPLENTYCSWEYIYGTTIPFSVSLENHYPWGHVQLLLEVKNGIISSVQMYTDSMDWTISDNIKSALTGCRFETVDIKNALVKVLPQSIADDLMNLF